MKGLVIDFDLILELFVGKFKKDILVRGKGGSWLKGIIEVELLKIFLVEIFERGLIVDCLFFFLLVEDKEEEEEECLEIMLIFFWMLG